MYIKNRNPLLYSASSTLEQNPIVFENVEGFVVPSVFLSPKFGQQRQRFVVTAGVKLGKVNVLQNDYYLHDKVDADFDIAGNTGMEYRPG